MMYWLKTVAAAALALGAGSGALAQHVSAPLAAEQNRPAVIYLSRQPGAPQFQSPSVSYITGGIAPYTTVAADEIAQQYSCVIRIDPTSDGAAFGNWMDSQSAVALLTSSALIDPAVHQVLGLSPAQRWEKLVVNVTSAGSRLARVEVILRKSSGAHYPDDAAHKTVMALIDRLKRAYEASGAASQKAGEARVKPIAEELAAASSKLADVRKRERDIRAQTSNIQANGSFYNRTSNQLSNLRSQRAMVQSELVRNQARLTAMGPAVSPTARWEPIVKARQKQLDDLQARAKEHKATDEQVQDAESKLADAQAQLAQTAQPPVNDVSSQFRDSQITSVKSNVAEEQTHLKELDDQITKMNDPKLLEELDSLPDLQSQEYPLRNRISELQIRLDSAQRSNEGDTTIMVTVLDGSTP